MGMAVWLQRLPIEVALGSGKTRRARRPARWDLARFIHQGFETVVPQRIESTAFGGVDDAAVGV
jgi:hypothetical protein